MSQRRKRNGAVLDADFSDKLLRGEDLSRLFRALVDSASSYTFVVERSSINWRASRVRERLIYVQNIALGNLASETILNDSKQVYLVLEYSDSGLARLDLKAREAEIWIDSPDVRLSLDDFRRGLNEFGLAPVFTPGSMALLAVWPFLLYFVMAAYLLVFDPRFRANEVLPSGAPYIPAELVIVGKIVAIPWTITLIFAVIVLIVRRMSGSMRQWPVYISLNGLVAGIGRLRISPISRGFVQ